MASSSGDIHMPSIMAKLKKKREARAGIMSKDDSLLSTTDAGRVLLNMQLKGPERPNVDDENKEDEEETLKLVKKIIRQTEHYFGDFNLPKDKFLLEKIEEHEGGWIPMSIMMTFKRLADLSNDPEFVLRALEKSKNGILEVDLVNQRIRRNPKRPLPEWNEEYRNELKDRTVFATGFPQEDTTLDELINFFEDNFDGVVDIRMRNRRKSENKDDRPRFLGSAFVTFRTKEQAVNFLQKRNLVFKGRKINSKWQKDFFDSKRSFDNDEFILELLDKTVWVHGIDRQNTTREELAKFFSQFRGASTIKRRMFLIPSNDNRDDHDGEEKWAFSGSIFLTFEDEESALDFAEGPEIDFFNGDKLKKMMQRDFFLQRGKFKRQLQQLTY